MRTSTIRIAAQDLAKAGFNANRPYEACDLIAIALDDKAAVKARVNADSMTLTVEVNTNQLLDAANTLRELGLI
ncbi:hypothetical protein SAMN04488518_102482 [Pseudovibrio ascidiaceicola]|uniref:Uncharacterized protein n=1 Tax=Pseudovibrio ascidiaceicola TaxID=285279 RepID=A0A1I3XAY2_9HYPH|nr:hypothetical protein [Pseudovibrio ascidiaceicola]SFK16715.1 hypothetical protein SAMN04488518_102482 [Pseudovibrio ascidiaceicola]